MHTAQWGYVLHQQGIEVISLFHADNGPVVDWAVEPRTAFNDHPAAWTCPDPVPPHRGPRSAPPLSAPAAAPAKAGTPRWAGRR